MEKYTLIVAEKPDSANRIAYALDVEGKPKKAAIYGVPYYQAYHNGNIVVVPALGHLYTISSKQKNSGYPVFDYQWVPRYKVERGAQRIRVWLKAISHLAKGADEFVDACDFDIEGSIIGFNILKYACGGQEASAKRMKYSTLTTEELQKSYNHLMPSLDFALIEAGLTRHEVDWLYGINLSRILTQAVQSYSGRYTTLSTGRVQGPTLRFIEEREKIIKCFVPTPYWTLNAEIDINETAFEVEYEKAFDTFSEANKVRDACETKEGKIEKIVLDEFIQNTPVPFNLGSLQSEAYRIFKYTPLRTLKILQHLYVAALVSYPRTSSEKLPPSIDYENTLKKLGKIPAYTKNVTELLSKSALKPNEGKKLDTAHPAIYPTGNLPEKSLDDAERNIIDLVIKRFLSVFVEPALRQSINVTVNIKGYLFRMAALRTLSEGWIKFYKPYVQTKEDSFPLLIEGKSGKVKKLILNEHFTKPPPRYNSCTLLLKMEREKIGTEATRAVTIQTLQDRKYLVGNDNLAMSDLGFGVIEVLNKFCPTVVSPDMTRHLEQEMELIQQGRGTKQKVLKEAVKILELLSLELKEKETVIGTKLCASLQKKRREERTLGSCPKCPDGKLLILRSKKSGKRFVGCSNYFKGKCSTSYPLPQTGTIKALSDLCESCHSPTIQLYYTKKTPWRICLNPICESKGVCPK
jgi:DNA topoisomerase-1